MRIPMACTMLFLSAAAAWAGTDQSRFVSCKNADAEKIQVSNCDFGKSGDGGGWGQCIVTTWRSGVQRSVWITGRLTPWGGSHPITKFEKQLNFTYSAGGFTCALNLPSATLYWVGDCDVTPASKACTVKIQDNGSNRYYKAIAGVPTSPPAQ